MTLMSSETEYKEQIQWPKFIGLVDGEEERTPSSSSPSKMTATTTTTTPGEASVNSRDALQLFTMGDDSGLLVVTGSVAWASPCRQ